MLGNTAYNWRGYTNVTGSYCSLSLLIVHPVMMPSVPAQSGIVAMRSAASGEARNGAAPKTKKIARTQADLCLQKLHIFGPLVIMLEGSCQ